MYETLSAKLVYQASWCGRRRRKKTLFRNVCSCPHPPTSGTRSTLTRNDTVALYYDIALNTYLHACVHAGQPVDGGGGVTGDVAERREEQSTVYTFN